ncbi:MFS general substrate transporter [Wallemia mellicola]|uniref:MFS general substrate transporter n=1 Tax=Wallemia mellicola TaxID=1708541 RepID=A0AB38MF58_9BASI|nr:MFS general substrate transporter [Wallemia mellicola]TIB84256.1 MFS general substrate transporter [Wallemia mellicola]TIC20510.1 MFS general substrate transporter [Wallemia mellicola]TIC32138.1 MFS general substrate transporter [Wallemia mellicola]TIC45849.1 MFS general substrate transporter [Wallemia mellicola]
MSNQETTKKLKLEVNNVNYNQLDELRTDEIDIALGASNNLQELNKRVLWKTDLHILPLITLAYLLNYLDRTNLGNSRTLNNDIEGGTMGEQIGLSSDRYNIIVCLFYVPYVLFEFPSNILMKKFTPSVHLSRIITLWGAITICTAAVNNYAGMIAIRIAMGIAEAGFFPGCIYYFAFWYKPSERATRMAIFASFTSLSGAFSGLIATGCSYLNGKGGIPGWKYLFILEGIPTIIIGVSIYFFLPDYPETAKFFTSEERAACLQRLGADTPKMSDSSFDKRSFIEVLKSLDFYIFAATYFLLAMGLNAFSYFGPTIISDLGYQGVQAQLLTVPPNAFATLVIILNSFLSDKLKHRPGFILIGISMVFIGYLVLAVESSLIGRMAAVFLIASTNAAVMPFLAYRLETVKFRNATATGLASSGTIAISNCSGIAAPFLFPSSDGPEYKMGSWTLVGMFTLSALVTIFLWFRFGNGANDELEMETSTDSEKKTAA